MVWLVQEHSGLQVGTRYSDVRVRNDENGKPIEYAISITRTVIVPAHKCQETVTEDQQREWVRQKMAQRSSCHRVLTHVVTLPFQVGPEGGQDTVNYNVELEIHSDPDISLDGRDTITNVYVSKIRQEGDRYWRTPNFYDRVVENAAEFWADEHMEELEALFKDN